MKIQTLREHVSDEWLSIARSQLPKGESQDYYRGLLDGFARASEAIGKLEQKGQALYFAALMVVLDDEFIKK